MSQNLKLKPLAEQVIVITGASSGIGLSTARMAARKGAKVVAVARNAEALAELEREVAGSGGTLSHVAADVSQREEVDRIVATTIKRHGGFDTWVNDAAVSIYGRLEQIPADEARRLFDVNFWGYVHGSLAAARHLRGRTGAAGAIVNVGSTVSERAMPLQGMYAASKHAVKGFTDALRMELEEEGAPVSVSLVKPGSINTPFTEHARNHMDRQPTYPPPVYDPSVVASVILHCAEHPTRDAFAGWGGKKNALMGRVAPRLTDLVMERMHFASQRKDEPPRRPQGNLYAHAGGGPRERGDYAGHVRRTSAFSQASLHPGLTATVLGTAGLLLAAGALAGSGRR
ncbi:MAG TPA: SDR family oxidoreductase [Humisphaera sp.]